MFEGFKEFDIVTFMKVNILITFRNFVTVMFYKLNLKD